METLKQLLAFPMFAASAWLTWVVAVQTGADGLALLLTGMLEAHYLAGGSIQNVVKALIAADKANIELSFQKAAAIDLAGRNIVDAVQTSVNPKVINCPDPETTTGNMLDAVAKDGIRLLVKARVTVRANIDRLVGGAGEETILARVGEGIVTTIGSAESHKHVLENPDLISKRVLEKGLDAGTAYEILSIDIADVDVGKNIGAELETDRAEAVVTSHPLVTRRGKCHRAAASTTSARSGRSAISWRLARAEDETMLSPPDLALL